jgi:ring-1,2-phenylacetyl-CoA epoxidase subunit PaaE
MAKGFHELTVARIDRDTPDSVAVSLDVPAGLRGQFSFLPGQYLTLRATIDGEDVRRSYSICSCPGDGELRVGVRRVEGGLLSSFANDRLKAGDRLQVMSPQGAFGVKVDPTARNDYLLVAAGSGITPLLSIARSVLEAEPQSRVTLLYGNRRVATIMFREELEDLKDRFLDRFVLFHVLSGEAQDVALFSGRIDAARIRAFHEAGMIDPASIDAAFVCGPGGMIEDVAAALASLGVDAARIRSERFTPAPDARPRPASGKARETAAQGVEIEIVLDGVRKAFRMAGPAETVLQAAQKSGIDLPFSCAGGMCATCRCKVVEGSVEMDVNYSLQPWETDAGYALACQSHPTSRRLVIDFDAV